MMRVTLWALVLALTCLYSCHGCWWSSPSPPRPPPARAPTTTTPRPPYKCECGVRNRVLGKIVGGENTDKGEFPWQVGLVQSITLKNSSTLPFCGGILLSSDTVLTAAHCKVENVTSDVSKFKVSI